MRQVYKHVCILWLLSLLAVGQTIAQNVNFTQYHLTPAQSNPALIATSNQTYVSLNYRRQFIKSGEAFLSPMFTVTMPWLREGKKRQGAIGLSILQDQTGEGGIFTTTGGMLSAAYNLPLGETKTGARFLSVGAQGAFFQQRLDVGLMQAGVQWRNGKFDPNLPHNENVDVNQKGFGNVNAGLLYYESDTCDNVRTYLGINFQNINRPNRSFVAGTKVPSPLYFTAIGGISVLNNEKLQVIPNVRFIRTSDKADEFRGGVSTYYKIQGDEGNKVGVNAWYDNQGTAAMGLEVHQPKYTIGLSYDLPIASINPSSVNAWELAISLKLGQKCRTPRVKKPKDEYILDTTDVEVRTELGDSTYKIVATINKLTKEVIKTDTIGRTFRENVANLIPTDDDLLIFKKVGYFFYRDDEINTATTQLLSDIVMIMKKFKLIEIEIIGHSCNIGTEEENQTLSENRAKRVQKFLTDGGLDVKRVKISGAGSTNPVMSNKMEYGRIKNRRVEFKVLRKGDEK